MRWGYRFFYGAMEGVDRESRHVLIAPILDEDGREIMGRHRIRYDYLVLAVGSVSNDFGTKGVAEHCIFLDSRLQADRFRTKLLNHCLRVSRTLQLDPDADAHVRVDIVGGGATGVELAAELYNAAVGAAPLRPGSVRREPPEGDLDRGGAAHPAGAARRAGRGGARRAGSAGRAGAHRRAGGGSHRRRHGHQVRRVDQGRPAGLGRGGEGAGHARTIWGWRPARSNQLVVRPTPADHAATSGSSPSATAPGSCPRARPAGAAARAGGASDGGGGLSQSQRA